MNWTRLGRDHGIALLGYVLLSMALTWPTVAHFTTSLTSDGTDARHELWLLWHTLQVILGRQPLFSSPLLFYPRGATLLTHSTGPINGLLALPFWPLGPAAAYNGTLILGLALSGYCMYLLARGLGFGRGVAFFAGCTVLAAPMSLAGLNLHLTKVFTGGMPLVLLALQHAANPRCSRWWTLATGAALLFVLLDNGYQFVYIGLAVAFFGLVALVAAKPGERRIVTLRLGAAALTSLLLAGPLLFAVVHAAANPEIKVAANVDSWERPDLVQFFLPDTLSRVFGGWTRATLKPFGDKITLSHETAVSLEWSSLLLCLPLLFRGDRPARRWLVFAGLCVLFALGPTLKVRGQDTFTTYHVPVTLPYAFLTSLSPLAFMRTPGRFMQVGVIGLGIAASYGLTLLIRRFPRLRVPFVGAAVALLLLQNWPQPYPAEQLRPVPPFYQQIAHDPEQYGVFDLPVKAAAGFSWGYAAMSTASIYQLYQMTHHKGIASAYLSRTYDPHPLFADLMSALPPVVQVNGVPAPYNNFQGDLARNNYRYVVLHKDLSQPGEPFAPGVKLARELLAIAFAGQPPVVDDALTTVYRVAPPNLIQFHLGTNWRLPEKNWQWATTPATLQVVSPCRQMAMLELTPAFIHAANSPDGMGPTGTLLLQVGSGAPTPIDLTAERMVRVPLALDAGNQTITLSLEAGNFHPSKDGHTDPSMLSFAMHSMNLQTGSQC